MSPTTEQIQRRRAEVLDDAYDRLAGHHFIEQPGFACHGPMGAEALSALGHDDLVATWVEDYKARHAPIPAPGSTERIDAGDEASWRTALGDPARLTDWQQMFTGELTDRPWPEVATTWVPRLLAGYGGAFTHGLLRTAHAVRAVGSMATPSGPAVDELATGLGYWAGTYTELPGRPRLDGDRTLDEALARLPRPDAAWNPVEAGMFLRLGELPDFAAAVEALAPPAQLDQALSDLTRTFARVVLANPGAAALGMVHTVTPVAATRSLLPYLPDASTGRVYAQLWQVGAAITIGFTSGLDHLAITAPTDDTPPPEPADLIDQAAEHRDPHVVKFTEACLNEHAIRPNPTYLHAAHHIMTAIPRW